jgi:hypothetical protein
VFDILLIGNDIPMLKVMKSSLRKSFSMKDLREVAYILSIKIYRDRSKRLIGLRQDVYIYKILNWFNIQDSKKGFLPMSYDITLSKKQCPLPPNEQERMSVIHYASAIGSIIYTMLCTHPDVSYALSVTSRYQSNYGESHYTILKNILKYLKRSKEAFLVSRGEEELALIGYTDASFQADTNDSKSQSNFVFCLNEGVVSWKSFKQDTVANWRTEAEYIATSKAAKESVWIKNFVSELAIVPSASSPMDLYYDNSGAIAQIKETRSHKKVKYVLQCYHLIHKIINRGDVKVCKVHTN